MRDALDRHDYVAAVQLYNGEFLAGFALQGCSAFDDWASRIRTDLNLTICDAAWKAAASAQPHEALKLLEVARAIRPYDESILRRYMLLQSEFGNANAGLCAYEDFRKRAAEELGTHPAPETRLLATSLVASGKQGAPTDGLITVPPTTPNAAKGTSIPAPSPVSARVRSIVAGSCVLAVFCVVGYQLAAHGFAARIEAPFVTVGAFGYIDQYGARISLDGIVGEQLQSEPLMRPRTWRGGPLVATGSVRHSSGGLLIETRLHKDATLLSIDTHLVPPTSTAHLGLAVADRIVRQIASLPDLPAQERGMLRIGMLINDAAEHRAQGSFANSDYDLERADELLSRIPDRSASWHLLKSRRLESSAWNSLMTGHATDASKGLENSYMALLEIPSPTHVTLARMGQIQYSRSLLATRRSDALVDSAIALSKQALDIYPENGQAWLTLSQAQFALGLYVDALSSAAKARQLLPFMESDLQLSVRRFLAAFNAGVDDMASAECTRIYSIDPYQWPAVSCSAMLYGWTDEVPPVRDLSRAVRALPDTPALFASNKRTTQLLVASALAQRGEHSEATVFDRVPQDVDGRIFWLAWHALHDAGGASRVYRELLDSPGGVRASRTYARLLRAVADSTAQSPIVSRTD